MSSISHGLSGVRNQDLSPITLIAKETKAPSLLWLLVPIFGWFKWIRYLLESDSCSLKDRSAKLIVQNAPSPMQTRIQSILNQPNGQNPPRIPTPPRHLNPPSKGYDSGTAMRQNFALLEAEAEFKQLHTYLLRDDTHHIPQEEVKKLEPWRNLLQSSSIGKDLSPTLSEIQKVLIEKYVHVPERQAYVKLG